MWEAELLPLTNLTVADFSAWALTEANPYKVTAARVMRKKKKKEEDEREEREDPFNVMMKASMEQSRKTKKKMDRTTKKRRTTTAVSNAGGANNVTTEQIPRPAPQSIKENGQDEASDNTLGNWSMHTWQFLQCFVEHMKSEVFFEERGSHELQGKWPRLAYSPVIEPSHDPQSWLNVFDDRDDRGIAELGRHDFAYPGVMMWAPELRWPHLYPDGRPMCCFHGKTECVSHIGWSHYPRRCYGTNGNVALIGRRYRCKEKEACRETPFTFFSYSTPVLATAPSYVQAHWRKHGFRITHQAAIAWEVVDRARSLLANGAGASGMRSSLIERYKQTHSCRRKMWRSHTNHVFEMNGAARTLFYDFDDPRSELRTPSLGYLLRVTLEEIESKIPYYTRKMQMVFGRNLSADHSHKVAKVVLIQGERGFDGIYTIMNEVGKILAFFFVSGTTLAEVEESLRQINGRYTIHGQQQGPVFFTTDRCCDEREFFAGEKNSGKKPIFPSLISQEVVQPEPIAESPATELQEHADPTFLSVAQIDLPLPHIVPSTLEIAEVTASEIIRRCQENMWNVISVDSEWAYGIDKWRRKAQGDNVDGPDVTQIGLPDGSTYVFLVRQYKKFPSALKQLLESADIKKVAHKISSDKSKLSEIGIALNGCIELGNLARERGVVRVANCALSEIVEALFGCKIKKDPHVRRCDWGKNQLSEEEIKYAAIDAYAHMMSYLKILRIPHVYPSNMPKPKASDLQGDSVLLFTKNLNCVVASGTVVGQEMEPTLFAPVGSKNTVNIRISRGDIRQPGALVAKSGMQSFQELLDNEEDDGGFIVVTWKVSQLRRSPPPPPQQHEISVVTIQVQVPITPPIQTDNLDADPDPDSGVDPEYGNDKGVKQDIEHIFLRFSKILKKSHGAFGAFMARLSDVFFVPSQADIAFIKMALRKSGLQEEEIKAKPWHFFKRRVRRSVPKPSDLEREFKRVVNLLANIEDSKSDEPLFSKKAWSQYRSTLRHIRKGCLSDIPGETYYVQIGEDSMGIPLFKCLRGTSALEGFHQKIRQLVRGFNISPRYAIALLMEYIYRWNHDIDVRILGLLRKYADFYDGWEIEEEIEVTADWDELLVLPHPTVRATKHFASTGESFGLNKAAADASTHRSDGDGDSDEELETEIAGLIDAINDGSLDNANSDENVVSSKQELTGSAAWVASTMGHSRPWGKVLTAIEKQFFRDNYHRFQGCALNEADNYSSIAFSRFALFWNELVEEEERGRRPKSDMSLKTAFSLQAYWKQLKKESNATATLLPVYEQNKDMRRELRGEHRVVHDANVAASFSVTVTNDEHMQLSRPGLDTKQNKAPAKVAAFVGPPVKGAAVFNTSVSATGKVINSGSKKNGRRCRQCGHEYGRGKLYSTAHPGIMSPGNTRGSASFLNPEDVCQVPTTERIPGFPLAKGQAMPRRSRAKS